MNAKAFQVTLRQLYSQLRGEMEISIVDRAYAAQNLDRLATILVQSVEDGAVVEFVLPFSREQSEAYWLSVFNAIAEQERLLFCATIDGQIVGMVQLYLSPEPNAPHRAEIFKLLVHRDFQGRGVGTALMLAVETEAVRLVRSLLILDTVLGGAGERLYRRLGWREIGVVPHHFVDPHGAAKASVYFIKFLDCGRDDA
ncbi:GNAT family N-acetyltransferase [Pararhizobium sp. DWP1-1-3]|uniref:GNAT family N-acetyltransferase n=1 Tax=Pararhizobium sp. DWP1-1-3 TaxID=2804652 RepID=UPI003CEA0FB0